MCFISARKIRLCIIFGGDVVSGKRESYFCLFICRCSPVGLFVSVRLLHARSYTALSNIATRSHTENANEQEHLFYSRCLKNIVDNKILQKNKTKLFPRTAIVQISKIVTLRVSCLLFSVFLVTHF